MLLGPAVGALNGILVSRLRLQPFIVTLATWSVWSGVALWILPTEGGTIPQKLINFGNGTLFSLATPVWLILALVVFWAWFEADAHGDRDQGDRLERELPLRSCRGVPTRLATTTAYALSGLFAALGGLFLVTQTASGSPTVGNDYILNSVAAVVIGGTSGYSAVAAASSGTIAGALILTLIASVIFILNISSFWTPVVTGLLLISAVLANSLILALYAFARRRGVGWSQSLTLRRLSGNPEHQYPRLRRSDRPLRRHEARSRRASRAPTTSGSSRSRPRSSASSPSARRS